MFSSNDELLHEDALEITEKNSCNLIDRSCCCDVNSLKRSECCCKSPTLGKDSRALVTETSKSKLLNAIISSIKCSDIPGDFQIGSLSDYEPASLNTFVFLLEEADFQTYLQENHVVELHLFLPYKPPKNII